jgi:hypothetical protein
MVAEAHFSKIRITSPDKVGALLRKIAQSSCPLLIRALSIPEIAVRGLAVAQSEYGKIPCLSIGNLSARGFAHLNQHSKSGIQVELVLASSKIVFVTTLSHFREQTCVVNFPSVIESTERRKEGRTSIVGNSRAYVSIDSWAPNPADFTTVPFLESSRQLTSLIIVGDVSMGGTMLVTRFPAAYRILSRPDQVETGLFHLPMKAPIKITAGIRWFKKTSEVISQPDTKNRTLVSFKIGIQFIDQSEELTKNLKQFLMRAAHANAI